MLAAFSLRGETNARQGNFWMWRKLVAGAALDDDLHTVLVLSLAGLDLSLWLLGHRFLLVM